MAVITTQQRALAGVEAVLFDFDGTLVDASAVILRAFAEVLEARGEPPFDEERLRRMIGRPLREMFAEALGGSPSEATLDECVADYRRRFGPIALPLSRLLPTVAETVGALAEGGLRLGVVTTRAADGALKILEGFGLAERFALVIGLEHVTHPKPHPEPVLRALAELGLPPTSALMVGDTPDDVLAGRGASVRTVGVTTGVHDAAALAAAGADLVVAEVGELVGPLLADT